MCCDRSLKRIYFPVLATVGATRSCLELELEFFYFGKGMESLCSLDGTKFFLKNIHPE